MKVRLALGLMSMAVLTVVPIASAASTEKVMRNDRVMIHKSVVEFDINPFVDRQRIMRHDRVNYTVVKNQKKVVKQQRIMRNDRVSFYQPAMPVAERVE